MNPLTQDRMPQIPRALLTDEQCKVADELAAGPRKGVKGPFIPLLRSPELLQRLQKVGEFLRFQSSLTPRVSEFATLVVSRQWTQQFEWFTHLPLALKAGTSRETLDTLRAGRRPAGMNPQEALVYDFVSELTTHHGVSQSSYDEAGREFGEQGVVELTSLVGYFTLISMLLNVAQTPPDVIAGEMPLPHLPG